MGYAYFISPKALASASVPTWAYDHAGLEQRQLIEGQASGRAQAWFFTLDATAMVLRHYRRGGLPAYLSADRYLWQGLSRSRPWRELNVLCELTTRGLPVPTPLGGRIKRQGLSYRADIVTERIKTARPLAECIAQGFDDWHAIGKTIAQFHAAGAGHADLNVRNVLIDAGGKVWLIDWDRGFLGAGSRQQQQSLQRLRRSLSREPRLETAAKQHWSALMAGYVEP
jgi:3-deoxy-D-manno-octulosonic acid kinase